MMTGEIYSIKTVNDFRKVPSKRREICVREFVVWLATIDAMTALAKGIKFKEPIFTWIDDDKHTIKAGFITSDGQRTPMVSGVMKGFGR